MASVIHQWCKGGTKNDARVHHQKSTEDLQPPDEGQEVENSVALDHNPTLLHRHTAMELFGAGTIFGAVSAITPPTAESQLTMYTVHWDFKRVEGVYKTGEYTFADVKPLIEHAAVLSYAKISTNLKRKRGA